MTPITDRAAFKCVDGFGAMLVPIETARELEAIAEELAEAYLALLALGYQDTGALARYQAMKEKAK